MFRTQNLIKIKNKYYNKQTQEQHTYNKKLIENKKVIQPIFILITKFMLKQIYIEMILY